MAGSMVGVVADGPDGGGAGGGDSADALHDERRRPGSGDDGWQIWAKAPAESARKKVESLLNAVRDAFSPLKSGSLHAAKDLESHWLNSRRNEANNGELLDVFHGSVKQQPGHDAVVIVVVVDERKKGFAFIKILIKSFCGVLFPNSSDGNAEEGGAWRRKKARKGGEGAASSFSGIFFLFFVF